MTGKETLSPPLVAVVVLNWNGLPDTLGCLASLQELPEAPSIYVVDNGSTDGSIEHLRESDLGFRLIALPSNLGFGRGMNAGLRVVMEHDPPIDFVWLLNNDTIVESTTLGRLLEVAESDPCIGIIGGQLVDADDPGHVQAVGGGRIGWFGFTSIDRSRPARPPDHLVGASLLIRREVLSKGGGFDERYFFYLEDTEFSVRARRAGWRLGVAEGATVRHRHGASINAGANARSIRSDVEYARSTAIFVSGLPWPERMAAIPVRLIAMIMRRVADGQMDRIEPILRAYGAGLRIGRTPPLIPAFAPSSRSRPVRDSLDDKRRKGEWGAPS